jgi:hypothetical protein
MNCLFPLHAIVVMLVVSLLTGCGQLTTPIVEPPSATMPPSPPIMTPGLPTAASPTEIPSPLTATQVPPTATLTAPMLIDGKDTWTLKTVTLDKTLTINNPAPQIIEAEPGKLLLLVEFECDTGQAPPFPVASSGSGPDYSQLYVVDSQQEKYLAVQFGVNFGSSLDKCTSFWIRFEPVPQDRSEFMLHFSDLSPVDLGP